MAYIRRRTGPVLCGCLRGVNALACFELSVAYDPKGGPAAIAPGTAANHFWIFAKFIARNGLRIGDTLRGHALALTSFDMGQGKSSFEIPTRNYKSLLKTGRRAGLINAIRGRCGNAALSSKAPK